MVSWILVEQISFYPGSKTMRFLIAITVSAFYTSFPAIVHTRCCEESDDTLETLWIALQERNPDFGESDCSLMGSCSGERYCFCLPRKQNYSFLFLRGKISVFQGYFKIKSLESLGKKDNHFLACKAFGSVRRVSWRIAFQQLLWRDVLSWEAFTTMLLYFSGNVLICIKFYSDNICECWFKKKSLRRIILLCHILHMHFMCVFGNGILQ